MGYGDADDSSKRAREVDEATSGWARLDTEHILREMIAHELRAGRLVPGRLAQVKRFGSELGFSVVETGRLIAQCRDQALKSTDPTERSYALRLLRPPQPRIPTRWKMAAAVVAALALDIALFLWLF